MYTHMQLRGSDRPPVTLATLARMKADGEKIASLTCYDASFAVLLDTADVDVVLVGDSLGMVIQGHDTTVPVTMDHMVYHSAAVARGLHRPFLIADLPFMSYPSQTLALEHSVRLMQHGGAKMVKLESGGKTTQLVESLASHDIAGCAHVGVKPQSVHKTGGFRVQGRERETAARLLEEARRLESAGGGTLLAGGVPGRPRDEHTPAPATIPTVRSSSPTICWISPPGASRASCGISWTARATISRRCNTTCAP